MKFIVVNDIHANSTALKKFSKILLNLDFDKLIFLGDLLSYGVNIKETIGLMNKLAERYDCIFIKGNHEQIYFDYQNNQDYQYKSFPEFILESILDTANKLDVLLINQFAWVNSFCYKDIVFSHANLCEYGNWSYLNTEKDFTLNYDILIKNNWHGAIFGHTHRAKYKKYQCDGISTDITELPINTNIDFYQADRFLVTNGSIGQPRDSVASFLVCEIDDNKVALRSVPMNYDIAAHCQSIIDSNLTTKTQRKLLSYYSGVLS